MPLNLFYTMVQKSQKSPKTQIKGGPALRQDPPPFIWVFGHFDFFAPWYRRGWEASSVKIS